MALSNAERQRRYRERKRAEQQKQPAPAVTEPVTRDAVTPAVAGVPELAARGLRLWRDVAATGPELQPGERVLLEEACRTADRLDVLDRILRGDQESWMTFQALNEDGSMVRVVLNSVLAESRQQQVALKQLLAELRQSRSGPAAKPGTSRRPAAGARPSAGGEVVPGVADLTARIARRSPQAAG